MVTIIDYEAGNLTSVKRALDNLEIHSRITADPEAIVTAERIIFPGVGHAASAMRMLNDSGIATALREAFGKGTPILGICLGTQIILGHSEEGDTECVGLIEGVCRRFRLDDPSLKIPHMGWNRIRIERRHALLADFPEDREVYFVHSYYPLPATEADICAVSEYGITFPSAIGRDNLFATQFHPEKSGPVGLSLLKKFNAWDGTP